MYKNKGLSSTARGYGAVHRKRRAALLPLAYGKLCDLCGKTMEVGQRLQLDHSQPLALNKNSVGDRMVHGSCNQRAGAQLGNEVLQQRKETGSPTRDW